MTRVTSDPDPKAAGAGRILALDGLRGAAAFIVVLFHYLAMLHPRWVADYATDPVPLVDTPLAILWNGPVAVFVFFVLSGFVMSAAAERRHDRPVGNTLMRYLRLALPVLASVLLAYLWLSILPNAAHDLAAAQDAPSPWLRHTLQAPLPGLAEPVHDGLFGNFLTGQSAFNNVLWTMQIELVGSVILFLVYWLGGFWLWLRYLALAAVAGLALVAMRDAYLCFVSGAIIYEARKAGLLDRVPPVLGGLALALGILLGAPGDGFAQRWGLDMLPAKLQPGNMEGLVPVVAASLILLAVQLTAGLGRLFERPVLQWLGRRSFALYLVHVPLLYTFVAWERQAVGMPMPVIALIYVAAALALAHVFTVLVDEPSLRLLGRIRRAAARLREARREAVIAPMKSHAPLWPWVLLGSLALMLPTLINGGATIYYDSAVYLSRPEGFLQLISALPFVDFAAGAASDPAQTASAMSDTVASGKLHIGYDGRSMFYQIAAWSALESGRLWPLVALQALLVAYPAALLMQRVIGIVPGWPFVIGLAALALLTPLGLFVSLVMPDILVAVLVLVVAVLMTGWSTLTWPERGVLFAIATFAILSHASHLALALVLPVFVLALQPRGQGLRRGAVLIWLACLSALSLEQAKTALQHRNADVVMLKRPYLVAHLIDHGPGVAYLRRSCPEAGFRLCNHLDKLPIDWREFLFGGATPDTLFHVNAPDRVKIAISREQLPFTVAVVAHDPVAVLDFAMRAALTQLTEFDPAGALLPRDQLPLFAKGFPKSVVAAFAQSPVLNVNGILTFLHLTTWAVTVLALGVIVWAFAHRRQAGLKRNQALACVIVLLGLVLNAAICGILASPYDRFQARIIWLLPLIGLALLAARARRPQPVRRHESHTPSGIDESVPQ